MMDRNVAMAESSVFDLVIMGGGITGASIAWEASLRGHKVLLLEKKTTDTVPLQQHQSLFTGVYDTSPGWSWALFASLFEKGDSLKKTWAISAFLCPS